MCLQYVIHHVWCVYSMLYTPSKLLGVEGNGKFRLFASSKTTKGASLYCGTAMTRFRLFETHNAFGLVESDVGRLP